VVASRPQEVICLEGLPFSQTYTFSIFDDMEDGLCYSPSTMTKEECGSYKLTLGDGTVLAEGGGQFDSAVERNQFTITNDGGDDDAFEEADDDAAANDDDDDDDDDDDYASDDRRRRAASDDITGKCTGNTCGTGDVTCPGSGPTLNKGSAVDGTDVATCCQEPLDCSAIPRARACKRKVSALGEKGVCTFRRARTNCGGRASPQRCHLKYKDDLGHKRNTCVWRENACVNDAKKSGCLNTDSFQDEAPAVASEQNCPDHLNVDVCNNNKYLDKTANSNCGWIRREKRTGKRGGWKYSCLSDCKDSDDKTKFRLKGGRKSNCAELFSGNPTDTSRKRTCNKRINSRSCASSSVLVRVHDYCPNACKTVGKGICV
jgi:hypothetical protein